MRTNTIPGLDVGLDFRGELSIPFETIHFLLTLIICRFVCTFYCFFTCFHFFLSFSRKTLLLILEIGLSCKILKTSINPDQKIIRRHSR